MEQIDGPRNTRNANMRSYKKVSEKQDELYRNLN